MHGVGALGWWCAVLASVLMVRPVSLNSRRRSGTIYLVGLDKNINNRSGMTLWLAYQLVVQKFRVQTPVSLMIQSFFSVCS